MHTQTSEIRTKRRVLYALAFIAAIACFAVITAAEARAQSGDAEFLAEEGVPPAGANDPNCEPDPDHPQPVVLVHGTFEGMAQNWAKLSPTLRGEGYCVYTLNYGERATGPIQDSAAELDEFVGDVRGLTGAEKVDIVGHSQGAMMPRHYIKNLGGASEVDDLVGLSPPNHGTKNPGALAAGLGGCTACAQQKAGSEFLQRLNSGTETPGGVSHTVIQTRYDEVVLPFTSAFLEGPESKVENILLQDFYPLDVTEHLGIPYDPLAYNFVFDALENPGPADSERVR